MTCIRPSTKDGCKTNLNQQGAVSSSLTENNRSITQRGKALTEFLTKRHRDCQRVPTKFVLIWKMLVDRQEALLQASWKSLSNRKPTESTHQKTTNLMSQLRQIALSTLITKIICRKGERWQLRQISQDSKELVSSKRN